MNTVFKNCLILLFLSAAFSVKADNLISNDNYKLFFGLFSEIGTHRTGAGLEGEFLAYEDVSLLDGLPVPGFEALSESLGFFSRIQALYYENDFGIPGEKLTGELHIGALYSAGRPSGLFNKYPQIWGNREHNLRFGFNGYLTTDSTSQITGQLDYMWIKNRSAFMMNYENDTMLFYLMDKYRTAAFKLSWLYDLGEDLIGCSLGFNLWAGERKNLWGISTDGSFYISEEAGRENTAQLYNAAEYSADVLYLSLMYNNYSLSFGYDSEMFKEYIHNSIHYVLNDAMLPIFDRPDRFYISFRIGLPDDLF